MPLYEYLCKHCGHRFEIIQKFSDPLVTTCPKCGTENAVEQVLSAPAVQFKGSGWYVTDYAKKNSSQGSSASPKVEASSDGKSGAKSETKSEAKSESKPAATSDSSKSK